jgi:hypothetical protein
MCWKISFGKRHHIAKLATAGQSFRDCGREDLPAPGGCVSTGQPTATGPAWFLSIGDVTATSGASPSEIASFIIFPGSPSPLGLTRCKSGSNSPLLPLEVGRIEGAARSVLSANPQGFSTSPAATAGPNKQIEKFYGHVICTTIPFGTFP